MSIFYTRISRETILNKVAVQYAKCFCLNNFKQGDIQLKKDCILSLCMSFVPFEILATMYLDLKIYYLCYRNGQACFSLLKIKMLVKKDTFNTMLTQTGYVYSIDVPSIINCNKIPLQLYKHFVKSILIRGNIILGRTGGIICRK